MHRTQVTLNILSKPNSYPVDLYSELDILPSSCETSLLPNMPLWADTTLAIRQEILFGETAEQNFTLNVRLRFAHPLYTIYQTKRNKDRLTVLKVLQNTTSLEFILNCLTYELSETFNLPAKWINQLKLLPQQKVFTFQKNRLKGMQSRAQSDREKIKMKKLEKKY